ncbi:hypothetical protein GCM10010302_44530 [Streptomyces polychromogenes]|uniref:Cupin 2 conserved barrel domain-containing protein n=1 Tax=Streptomyces polychromogenes TaxID=67342 RepID=A0ABP3F448_9ACTN
MEVERETQAATVAGLLAAVADGQSGALWRLRGAGRQLDANLVRHLPGTGGAQYTEDEVDVMLVVVSGTGILTLDGAQSHLSAGFLALLPRGSARALLAGPKGLVVLTVHRKRRGMTIAPPAPAAEVPAAPAPASAAAPAAEVPAAPATAAADVPVPAAAAPPQCAVHLVCVRCHRHAIEVDARYCTGCGTRLPARAAAG